MSRNRWTDHPRIRIPSRLRNCPSVGSILCKPYCTSQDTVPIRYNYVLDDESRLPDWYSENGRLRLVAPVFMQLFLECSKRNSLHWMWPRFGLWLSNREWCWMEGRYKVGVIDWAIHCCCPNRGSNSPAGRPAPSCMNQPNNWWNWRNRRYRLHRSCRSRWEGWRRYCSVSRRTVRSRQLERKR